MNLMPGRGLIDAARERVLTMYGGAIGQDRHKVITPALVLDIASTQRNIDQMAAELHGRHAGIRPHIKVHKSPDLARRQIAAGAVGLSTATVWEAIVMAEAGIDDLFVVNTVAEPDKVRVIAELARGRRVLCLRST